MSSPGAPPAAPTFEASKCAWIMARALSWFIETPSGGARVCCGPPVPAMEGRPVARVPGLAEGGNAEVPVGADVGADGAQVVPEVIDRGAPPEPVAVVEAMDDEPWLEHERVRDHRVVLGVGVLLDVEVLLDDPPRVGEERPLRADRGAE